MKEKTCDQCRSIIKRPEWAAGKKWERMRFCSLSCSRKNALARRPANHLAKYRFKKGLTPWNKGKKYSREYVIEKFAGERNANWKGENATYKAIHKWLNDNYPRTGVCARCKARTGTDYANMNGIYDRNPVNYIELCYECHMNLDAGTLIVDVWTS